MALTKNSIRGLGALCSISVIALSSFFVAKPFYETSQENVSQTQSVQEVTKTKETQLEVLEEGVSNFDEIQAYVDNFMSIVSAEKDVESISRSISNATPPGIHINSFSFGKEENIAELPVPKPTLSGYEIPTGFEEQVEAPVEEAAPAAVDTFYRIPVTITVTGQDYNTLSKYLDDLSEQSRLISVISINSLKSVSEEEENSEISATVYAYAFAYAR